jgi:superfamily II DNA or RNA helicase
MQFSELSGQFAPDPHVRGRQFESLCRWYLQNAPEYRNKLKQVWLWRDWPDRWGADAGIDLVAETREGELWAVQAKAYDPAYAIKKSDVDTFLSESSRPQFAFRLLIATTDGIGDNAYRTLVDQEKPVGLALRSHLDAAAVEWPPDFDSLLPARAHPKTPRPHQQEAIDAVRFGFADAERGQLIMACGTGKTLVALWAAEALGSQRTLVLVPSLTLLSQTLREWTANSADPFDYLAVCSDDTVAAGHDAMVSWTADLGLPVTTDAAAIEHFLRREGHGVVFATYQSSRRIAEAQASGAPAFDLVIADEAHRCTGPASGDFATVLEPDKIRAARRLFMTATPRYFTDRVKKVAGEADYEVASMDDQASFGRVFHQLTFGQAIERDLLSDYQVLVVGVDDEMCVAYVERGAFVTLDGKDVTDARTLASHIAVAKAVKKYDLKKTITFHSRVNKAQAFSATFPAVVGSMPVDERPSGQVWSRYVSGEMPTSKRDVLLQQFRHLDEDSRGLLANARCLAEGVDVPAIDGVAFIDPRSSTVDIVQAVGRAIRKSEDKTHGTIVLPVFLRDGEDAETTLDDSSFKAVWQVLNALRAHDNILAEELDALRRGIGKDRSTSIGRPAKIELDVPMRLGSEFVQAFDVRLVDQTTASWEFWFGLLQTFVEREGHARAPQRHLEGDVSLGNWVASQRNAFRANRLSEERRKRLEALPGWAWDQLDSEWEEAIGKLLQFVEREGDARVPVEHREDGFRLGRWAGTQRTKFKAKQLGEERRRRLEAIPGWVWEPFDANWEDGFARLAEFVEREGHARVPLGHREGEFALGTWVARQRTLFNATQLNQERQQRLSALVGWVWRPSENKWEDAFATLAEFIERESHARVPVEHLESGSSLGRWVGTQRAMFKDGRLSDTRRRRLEAVPGWAWEDSDVKWETGMAELLRFVEREGHVRVKRSYVQDGYRLGTWLHNQRTAVKAKQLSDERRRRLESLPGWIGDEFDARWEVGFSNLLEFVEHERHAAVQKRHVEGGFPLGQWVGSQRREFRAKRLTDDRRQRLEALPGWVWEPYDRGWEDGFARLVEFVEREGHARVPQKHAEGGFKLGQWVSTQRRVFKATVLSDERRRRLEALPGWVW